MRLARSSSADGRSQKGSRVVTTSQKRIVYKRGRRSNRDHTEVHYLLVNERRVRVKLGALICVEFDYDSEEPGAVFSTDYLGTIYRYSDREWCEARGTYFYPFATRDEAALFNAILDEVAKRTAR